MARSDKARRSQAFIEENLKRVYQEKVEEEIPDRFTNLLQQLRDKQESQPDSHDDNGTGGSDK